jgi:hypothetical protein
MAALKDQPQMQALTYGTHAHETYSHQNLTLESVLLAMFSLFCAAVASGALLATIGASRGELFILFAPMGLCAAIVGRKLARSSYACAVPHNILAFLATMWNNLALLGYTVLFVAGLLSLFDIV